MRRHFLTLVMLLCCGIAAMAVPAKPGWHVMTQSDGTTLKIHTVGNAFNHAVLTSDGLMVARGSDGDFYYTSLVTGLTAMRAHDVDNRTAAEAAFVNAQRGSLTMPANPVKMYRQQKGKFTVGGSNDDSGVPAQGVRRIPIILVEFKDKKFNNTREDIIDAMLMGNQSVGQYFRDQSNGMYEPEFDVYGIYTLSQNRSYYGGNDINGRDKRLGAMVAEACRKMAAAGVSFKPYDTNNDDYCDVVIVIYAGVGEAQTNGNCPESIWPCNWYLSYAYDSGMGGNGAFRPSNGDPMVDMFAVFNELYGSNDNGKTIDGIGTFTHEFGHCLGLPDLYDTGNHVNEEEHYGMGYWDIMCLGCYNNDGFTPPGYSAYEKVFMGWMEYIAPTPGTYYTLPVFNQKNAATDKAVCIVSNLNENEFFILENRKRQGWDRYMPGEGIMITHVTYDSNRWWDNTLNNEDIQLMTLMNADNSWSYYDEDTDLWPQGNNREFTDNSTPAARLNMRANGSITGNAGYLGKPVTDMVINSDGTASFWYMKEAATRPIISVSTEDLDFGDVMMNSSRQMTFKVIGNAMTDDVTLSLNDADGVFTIDPAVISATDVLDGILVTVTFSPDAISDYNAVVTLSSEGAQDVVINLTGHGLIVGYAPVMQPADSTYIGLTQFRAEWTDQTPAENLSSYTLEVSPKPEYQLLETADLSTVPNALENNNLVDISGNYGDYLPAGWSATSYVYAYNNALIMAYNGTITTPIYSFTGYDKLTVVVKAASYYYNNSSIRVSTSLGAQELAIGSDFADYTIVLDCAGVDAATIQAVNNYTSIKQVTVYVGDLTAANVRASEMGDLTYRLITGITDKFYTVDDLQPEGSFIYKVKALFVDGTESDWSNVELVTLFENGHGYAPGDVNHDGNKSISDVTDLIRYLLSGGDICSICADVNGDTVISISDVTALISILLTSN